jgi:putative Mg2+ transporter-C (MgtC) family protein
VRGLTTAAIVWLTAAVGMACGAGLPILALVVTAGHFVIVFAFPYIAQRLPKSRWTPSLLQISYQDGREILREVLVVCTQYDFAVSRLQVERPALPADPLSTDLAEGKVTVILELRGTASIAELVGKRSSIDGVASVNAGDINVLPDGP